MKTCQGILLLLLYSIICSGQTSAFPYEPPQLDYFSQYASSNPASTQDPISKFALSINPLGFAQFGPVISAEFGIREDLVINTHVRFGSLGVLSYVVKAHVDGLDNLSEYAFGGGVIKFFGENQNKPYAGVLLEYGFTSELYGESAQWEWTQNQGYIVFILNGGYRFRFQDGFFINTGAYFGASTGWYNWDYTDPSYGTYDDSPRSGTTLTPFGMLEVTVGKEF